MRKTAPQDAEIALFLSRPQTYRDGTGSVRVRQTSTSWVFLTDHFAYKLKKPMQWGGEDFSTLERREKIFREELRLGRRFAPRIYLSVISVNRNERGELALRGMGSIVEWLLEMRRLDERQSLAWLLEFGEVRREMIDSLAAQLAEFYAGMPPISLKAEDYIAMLSERINANYRKLLVHSADPTTLEAAHRAQSEFLSQRDSELAKRVCDGRIVDAHGDLRPEHIYFDGIPALIGCTTARDAMRWSDVADDLAALAMECDSRGASKIGSQIKDCYISQSGDVIDENLFTFYKCYRAHCRAATVVCSRPDRNALETNRTTREPDDYMRLASDYAKLLSSV